MTTQMPATAVYETLQLSRSGRVLTIAMNRPDALNAVNLRLHQELAEVFVFACTDEHSDVVVLTGNGRAFSAGGDMGHMRDNAENPELFDEEVRLAKRIIFAMLDLDKPLVCRMNGHAVGLGATLALYCDVIFAAERVAHGTGRSRYRPDQSLCSARGARCARRCILPASVGRRAAGDPLHQGVAQPGIETRDACIARYRARLRGVNHPFGRSPGSGIRA